MSEDVGGVDEGLLFGAVERAEEGGDVLVEVIGVGAIEEDGVGVPGFVEVPGALYGDGVSRGIREWNFIAAVGFEGDAQRRVDGFA